MGKSDYLLKASKAQPSFTTEIVRPLMKGDRYYLGSHLLDTGTLYNMEAHCNSSELRVGVAFYSGVSDELDYCQTSQAMEWTSLKFPQDIVGLLELLSAEQIIFSPATKDADLTDLYIDNDTIYFHGLVNDDDINICIDSGAIQSSFTATFYDKSKDKTHDRDVYKITVPNSKSASYVRGILLTEVSIKINSLDITLKDIPVLIDQTQWFHCDLMAGSDFISHYISYISFKEMKVGF